MRMSAAIPIEHARLIYLVARTRVISALSWRSFQDYFARRKCHELEFEVIYACGGAVLLFSHHTLAAAISALIQCIVVEIKPGDV